LERRHGDQVSLCRASRVQKGATEYQRVVQVSNVRATGPALATSHCRSAESGAGLQRMGPAAAASFRTAPTSGAFAGLDKIV
jgi:hypothetical protein